MNQTGKLVEAPGVLFDEANIRRLWRILINLEAASARLPALEARIEKAFDETSALGSATRFTLNQINDLTLERAISRRVGRVTGSVEAMAEAGKLAGETFTGETLPPLNALLDDAHTATLRLGRLSSVIETAPNALLFGRRPPEPGPGEPATRNRNETTCCCFEISCLESDPDRKSDPDRIGLWACARPLYRAGLS